MTRAAVGLSFVLLLSAGGSALGGDDSSAEELKRLVARAKVHYDLGEFQQAADAYIEAYRTRPLPALLYNIAQCYRKAGQYEKAKQFYERYLPETQDRKSRAVIENTIKEIGELLAKEKGAKESAPNGVTVELNDGAPRPAPDRSTPPAPLTPASAKPKGTAPTAQAMTAAPPSPPPAPVAAAPREPAAMRPEHAGPVAAARRLPEVRPQARERNHVAPLVVAGASAVAFAAGGVFGAKTLSSHSVGDARTANVLYGVGGGLALASGALFYFEF